MRFFERKQSSLEEPSPGDLRLKRRRREPGQGAELETVFEVWGDVLDCTYLNSTELDELAIRAVDHMARTFKALLDLPENDQTIELCSDPYDAPYLLINWNQFQGEIGVRPIGKCLDLFGILMVPRNFGADPNPLVRLAKLSANDRRDLSTFQSLLKYVLEQTIEALDEQRIV